MVGVSALTRVRERSAESGLVETDVPSFANPQQLQVNAAEALDSGFVAAAFLVQVARQPIGQVGVPRINVHVAEQMMIHVIPVGVRVGREQADIFIQVERAAQGEIKLLGLVHPHQVPIDAFHRLAGCQAQDQVRVGAQLTGNDAGHQRARRLPGSAV